MVEYKLQDFKIGLEHLKVYLANIKFSPVMSIPLNQNRYLLLIGKDTRLLTVFKREPFFKFGEFFKGYTELGETINTDTIQYCVKKKVDKILIVYETGKVFETTIQNFLEKSFSRVTDNEQKATRSISLNDLTLVAYLEKENNNGK